MTENRKVLTKRQLLRSAGLSAFWLVVAGPVTSIAKTGGDVEKASNIKCADCPMRARYDRNPKSILSRIWKWHTGWCPGWKSYLASLPEDEKRQVMERYK